MDPLPDFHKGEQAFSEVLTILEKDGTERQLIVKTLNNLAGIDCANGRISDATEYSVSDHQKTYFSEHQAGRAGRACGA